MTETHPDAIDHVRLERRGRTIRLTLDCSTLDLADVLCEALRRQCAAKELVFDFDDDLTSFVITGDRQ